MVEPPTGPLPSTDNTHNSMNPTDNVDLTHITITNGDTATTTTSSEAPPSTDGKLSSPELPDGTVTLPRVHTSAPPIGASVAKSSNQRASLSLPSSRHTCDRRCMQRCCQSTATVVLGTADTGR
jgi:hypothetical protein